MDWINSSSYSTLVSVSVWIAFLVLLWRHELRKRLFGKRNARALLIELKHHRDGYLGNPIDLKREIWLGRQGLALWPASTLVIALAVIEAPEENEHA